MNQAWFPESNLFGELLDRPTGRMPLAEALALLQGDGQRLERLLQTGWLLRLEEEVWAGAALRGLRRSMATSSWEESLARWEVDGNWLLTAATAAVDHLDTTAARQLWQRLSDWRLGSYALRDQSWREAEKVPSPADWSALLQLLTQFWDHLSDLDLATPVLPELEAEQLALLGQLRQWQEEVQQFPLRSVTNRQRALQRILQIPAAMWEENETLRQWLSAHDRLVLGGPLRLAPQLVAPPASPPSTSGLSVEIRRPAATVQPLWERFVTSGQDLWQFLEADQALAACSHSERLHWLSLMMQTYQDRLTIEATSQGSQNQWQIWLKNPE